MTEETPAYRATMAMGGADIDLEIQRTAEAVLRDGPYRTFSAEAMSGLCDQMALWVGTRVLRALDGGQISPQRLTVRLHVELDGEAAR